jgi:hypothetical protein
MVKSNIPIYIYYFFKNPIVFYNTIINPEHFPKGSDTDKIIMNKPYTVIKFFKNSSTFRITNDAVSILENCDFIPKTLNIDSSNLSIKQEYCGNILDLRKNLPINWKEQFNKIRQTFIDKNILLTDIDTYDLNPYIIYNICVKNNNLYIIDFGDWKEANSREIDNYFNNLENKVEYILNLNRIRIVLYVLYTLVYKLIISIKKKLINIFYYSIGIIISYDLLFHINYYFSRLVIENL